MRGAASPGNLLRRRSSESRSHPGDERRARAELRRQIGRLELELARLTFEGFGRLDVPHRVAAIAPGPRLLGLGELERLRDALAERDIQGLSGAATAQALGLSRAAMKSRLRRGREAVRSGLQTAPDPSGAGASEDA